jgi:carbon-monoxide dehydrogenase large subunit
MLHAGFVRSPHAHARIVAVDDGAGLALPGVVGVFASDDLPALTKPVPGNPTLPGMRAHSFPPLARDFVRYAGEPVAAVLAEDPHTVADAIDAISIEYEPIEAVSDPEAAVSGSSLVWDDVPNNIAVEYETGFGDVDRAFADADVIIEGRFAVGRSAGAAIEPRTTAAVPGGAGEPCLTIWAPTQAPHIMRAALARHLDLNEDEVRIIVPDVGGGFGPKGRQYPEDYTIAALALHLGRPVRFVLTRTEDLLTTWHGRGQVHHARLAARADGTILALDDRLLQDAGAYAPSGVGVAGNTTIHLMGPYRVPAVRVRVTGVYTNRVPTSPLRGGGRPEGIYVMERLLDRLARRLGLDPAEVRRRNLIPPDAFPHNTGMPSARGGTVIYDSGNYPAYLDTALERIGYSAFQRQQEEARRTGRYLGLGLAAFIESTGAGAETARVRVCLDGRVEVHIGSPSNGQGHATTFAQMAADRLGVSFDAVTVGSGDTGAVDQGTGTFASRMGQYGGNAVSLAARAARERVLRLAADLLEISPADLELADGEVTVKGMPDRRLTLAELAQVVAERGQTLEATETFQPSPGNTWAGGVDAAIVEVDTETGTVSIQRYVIVHDSGTLVNPMVVEGQIHGGTLHGIANVLYEDFRYDEAGQPRTATFMDYTLPGAVEAPPLDITHFETPSPFNPEGIKGAGEGGTIAAIPTLVSAIEDALSPFGVQLNDVPLRIEQLAGLHRD